MKFCKYCGNLEPDPEARFCEKCGKRFSLVKVLDTDSLRSLIKKNN